MESIIKKLIVNTQIKRRNTNQIKETRQLAEKFGKASLSKGDLAAIKNTWGRLGIKFQLDFYKLVKNFIDKDLDPRYVSSDLFYPYILRSLNPAKYCGAYEHKGTYHRFYREIRQPAMFVNCIGGIFYDSEGNQVTAEQAIETLIGKSFIAKPTTDTLCGQNVRALRNTTKEEVRQLFEAYETDFIIQEICSQSQSTKAFNPSSLNTFRVTTLNLNNHFSVINILFRCGRGDIVVDNGGAGGLMCGCDTEGQLMPYALDNDLNRYTESSTGQPFGIKIPEVKNILQAIESNINTVLPFCAIAGWDFALDADNNPVMIEVNLGGSIGLYPGIFTEQLCNETPLFGERTNEVVDWVTNHRPHIRELFMS